MLRAALIALLLGSALFTSTTPLRAQNAATPVDAAIDEAVRREAFRKDLDIKLADAQAAQKRGEHLAAARYYESCLDLIQKIGSGVETQQQQVMTGYIAARLEIAQQFQRTGDFGSASNQVGRILKVDPRNEAALAFKRQNDDLWFRQAGRTPDQDTIEKLPDAFNQRVKVNTLVQNAKLMIEAGKTDEAEIQIKQAQKLDPGNRAADYYENIIIESRHRTENLRREEGSKNDLLDVDGAWNIKSARSALPQPNSYARTNIVHTSKLRAAIFQKLDMIRIPELKYEGPLSDLITQLSKEAENRDPQKHRLNFIISQNGDVAAPPAVTIDPNTGLPTPQAGAEATDLGSVTIKISPGLSDVTLSQVLDTIIKTADRPIKYSVEDYAIMFTHRTPETPPLYTRFFKVDPNTFSQGLQGVVPLVFGATGGGGASGGGGGASGGGGGSRGGGGGGGGGVGGGGGGQQQQSGNAEYIGVSLVGAQRRAGGAGGGGGFQPAAPGQPGARPNQGALQGGGVNYLTFATPTDLAITDVREFFRTAGVNLDPPKNIYFNDRSGLLMIRATLQDLDIIEQALHVLNQTPPELTIEAKFAEITQDDTRALGFDWTLGNTRLFGGKTAIDGGTAPSYLGRPSFGNPSGVFPGPLALDGSGLPTVPTPATLAAQATDGNITSGLRNTAPALFSYTGILTDPQFRVVIKALEQRDGADLLSAPKITTMSARQAQIKVVDVRYIVTSLDLSQTGGGGGGITTGTTGAGGAVGSTIQPLAEPIELGPVLDIVPYISADGFTVQMTIIPTIKEFVGYDLETSKIFTAQAQSVAAGSATGNALQQQTPLPIFRLRQVVTSVVVWDGQTVVLGGLISENVMKTKDKVPVLGDLPLLGRLFRSESSATKKKNLLIFVTPTIIDPAGNRLHSEEEMPFAQNSLPPQTPIRTVNP